MAGLSIGPLMKRSQLPQFLGWTVHQWAAAAAALGDNEEPTIYGAPKLQRHWRMQHIAEPLQVGVSARNYDWAVLLFMDVARAAFQRSG